MDFWLILSYQEPFVFTDSLLWASNIYSKNNFMDRNVFDQCNFYNNELFEIFY